MFLRITPLLCLFYFLNAQIALPTFQTVQKPHSASSSSDPYTFTNCGATGKSGPTQSDCNSEYSGTSLDGNVTVSNGIQTWTVPSSGTYTIEAWGADGGNGDIAYSYDTKGGDGRKLKVNFSLAQGSELNILVGQRGEDASNNCCHAGGGGGGTFVTYSNNTPIIVASGGNGGSWGYWNVDGPDGLFSNAGNTYGGSTNGRAGGGGGGYNGGTVVNTNQYNTDYPSYGAGSFTAEGAGSIIDIGTNDGVGKVIITKN